MNKFKRKLITLMAVVACSIGINGKALVAGADESVFNATVIETSVEIGDFSTAELLSEENVDLDENTPQNEQESVESEDEEDGFTVDDFLGIMQDKADEYGVGDEWKETLENLQYAVKEKKFDALFIWNIAQTVLLLCYVIYKIIVNASIGKIKAEIVNIKAMLSKLATTENQLVDEMKETNKEEREIKERQKYYAKAMECTNEALSQMVDGINFTPEKKTAATRKLNKAIKYLEEGAKNDGSTH